jgi:hypothetical protein
MYCAQHPGRRPPGPAKCLGVFGERVRAPDSGVKTGNPGHRAAKAVLQAVPHNGQL